MKQSGIALIQVLLIVALLSILALYLSKTARTQVKVAQWYVDKGQALVELKNAETELLFTLLTEDKLSSISSLVNKWNFYNEPFEFNQIVSVSMQDQAGLINAHFPEQDRLQQFIKQHGFSQSIAILDTLLDWQDVDSIPRRNGNESGIGEQGVRNGAIPNIEDLSHIKIIPPTLFTLLQNNMTIYREGYYNPMNSPRESLEMFVSKDVVEQIVQLRKSKQLSKRSFSQLSGLNEDEDQFFYPSNNIAIELTSKVGESIVKHKIVVQIKPYAVLDVAPVSIPYIRG